jgi:mono/diheme cytochrome c family protein
MNRFVRYTACAIATSFTAAALAADKPASAARGKQIFNAVGCIHCHGSEGQGSSAGARIAPRALPAEAIAAFLRATTTNMPTYSAQVLSDADVADIAAFLASIPPPKSADSIPALKDLKAP